MTTDGGRAWQSAGLVLRDGEQVTGAAVSAHGQTAVIAGNEGSIFRTADSGRNWEPMSLRMEGHDWVEALVWVDQNSGSSQGDVSAFPDSFVAKTNRGHYYILAPYPDLTDWRQLALEKIRSMMEFHDILGNSAEFRSISTFVDQTGGPTNVEYENNTAVAGDSKGFLQIDDLTIKRIVASTILFFLVQLLVRLYQYSLRLAAFWDSRSDAILLNNSFVENKADRFNDLVVALAPDTYDFKTLSKSPLDWLYPRQKH